MQLEAQTKEITSTLVMLRIVEDADVKTVYESQKTINVVIGKYDELRSKPRSDLGPIPDDFNTCVCSVNGSTAAFQA